MRKLMFLAVPALFVGAAVFSEPTEGGLIFHRGARGCAGWRAARIRDACCCQPVQMNYGCSGAAVQYYSAPSCAGTQGGLELRQPLPPSNLNGASASIQPTLAPDVEIPDTTRRSEPPLPR